jgi:hypothetical protein
VLGFHAADAVGVHLKVKAEMGGLKQTLPKGSCTPTYCCCWMR